MAIAYATWLLSSTGTPAPEDRATAHLQRYCMGTMFDIVVYHASRTEAERAADKAMAEIVRLDQVLSHFKADSDLSRLLQSGRDRFTAVAPDLYAVLERSLEFARLSHGRFDVTVGPLVKLWRQAQATGQPPSEAALEAARRCVGYGRIQLRHPDQVRLQSPCLEIDLGGIGKGYAVDRAMAILRDAGIERASVNAGGSSIAAAGSPPGRTGWPVDVGSVAAGGRVLLLRDTSISTSRQALVSLLSDRGAAGDIIDPATGRPAGDAGSISVVARSATVSDALSTTLLLMPRADAEDLLARIADVSAIWISPEGRFESAYRGSALAFVEPR